MFKKVAFTMYPITDVPRARKFYEETLGLKRGSMGNQGDKYWIEYDLPPAAAASVSPTSSLIRRATRRAERSRSKSRISTSS